MIKIVCTKREKKKKKNKTAQVINQGMGFSLQSTQVLKCKIIVLFSEAFPPASESFRGGKKSR